MGFRIWLVALAMLLGLAEPAWPWEVYFKGVDVTAAAGPIESGGVVLLDATGLGPALGLAVQVLGNQAVISAAGGRWTIEPGALQVAGQERILFLDQPAQFQGSSLYLPAVALADLAGQEIYIDAAEETIRLGSTPRAPRAEPAEASSLLATDVSAQGWEPLRVEKTEEEKGRMRQEEEELAVKGLGRAAARLLPDEEAPLQLGVGPGYVQGGDAGLALTVSGNFYGRELSGDALVTQGAGGTRVENSRLSLFDPLEGWQVDAGDLHSDIWGLRRGLGYSFEAGGHQPSLLLYTDANESVGTIMSLAVRDDISLTPGWQVGGEFATDGSFLARTGLSTGDFNLYGYELGGTGDGRGLLASYALGSTSLYGSLSSSGTGVDYSQLQTIGLRRPLWNQAYLNLEQRRNLTSFQDQRVSSVRLGVPVGPVSLLTRYERRETRRLGLPGFSEPLRSEDLHVSLRYWRHPFGADYQTVFSLTPGVRRERYEQLTLNCLLGSKGRLQVISSSPGFLDTSEMRYRWQQQLSPSLALTLEYGPLIPYQTETVVDTTRGFTLNLRHLFDISTPTRGGRVAGRVVDQAGNPVAGVAVRANQYLEVTDARGAYLFEPLPVGTYRLEVEEESIPANYLGSDLSEDIEVGLRDSLERDFVLVPLNSVSGRILEAGTEEPMEGIVVRLDGGFTTAADAEGRFSFYNLEPGPHRIEVPPEFLPRGWEPAGSKEISVELTPENALQGVDFLLRPKERKIRFQELP